jgi:hypothetical protein
MPDDRRISSFSLSRRCFKKISQNQRLQEQILILTFGKDEPIIYSVIVQKFPFKAQVPTASTHHINNLPDCLKRDVKGGENRSILRLCGNPMFASNGKALIYGGDSAYPPEPPLCFAIVLYYLFWSYRFRGCHSGGGGGIPCRSSKER